MLCGPPGVTCLLICLCVGVTSKLPRIVSSKDSCCTDTGGDCQLCVAVSYHHGLKADCASCQDHLIDSCLVHAGPGYAASVSCHG